MWLGVHLSARHMLRRGPGLVLSGTLFFYNFFFTMFCCDSVLL